MLLARNWPNVIAALLAVMNSAIAEAVAPDTDVRDLRQISLSSQFGCAVTLGGALRCYGDNSHGQIGNGTSGTRLKLPVQVIASGVSAVATGRLHACAVVNGALLCWGDNNFGQLGNGSDRGIVVRPTQVIANGVTAVAAGPAHTCAVVSGALQCWGSNRFGQIGNVAGRGKVISPAQVIASGVTAVATGGQHTCAVVSGALKCWGYIDASSSQAALPGGIKPVPGFRDVPVPTEVIARGVTAVSASIHTCAVVKEALQCWGRNFNGQVGATGPVNTPTQVLANGVTAVATSDTNTCAIVHGALYCWGANQHGQLGDSVSLWRAEKPVQVIPGGVTAVALNEYQTCAVVHGVLHCTQSLGPFVKHPPGTGGFLADNTPFSIPLPRYGVWQGTIGKQAVMVRLESKKCDSSSYYYMRYLSPINLTEMDRRGLLWAEGSPEKPAATLKFESVSYDAIEGLWTAGDGQRSVPISLKRAASNADVDQCSERNVVFSAPLVAAQKAKELVDEQKAIVTESRYGNHRYRTVSVLNGRVQTIELPEDGYKAENLNKAMRNWMRTQITEYYGCQAGMNDRQSDGTASAPDFEQNMTPEFWDGQLLVVKESYSAYCGGAYPSAGIAGYTTWNLTTDQAVDPWTWIRLSKTKHGDEVPEKLNAIILARATRNKGGDDCSDSVNENRNYLLRPSKKGLVFSTSFAHVIQACNEDIEVPYGELLPHLTPAGAAVAKSLIWSKGGRQ